MNQSEATVQYAQALKAGQKTYKDCVLTGRYPYLQILDEILDDSMVAGVVDQMCIRDSRVSLLQRPRSRCRLF